MTIIDHIWDFIWCIANAPVDSNCSMHMSQMFCLVRDCVAEGLGPGTGDGADDDLSDGVGELGFEIDVYNF